MNNQDRLQQLKVRLNRIADLTNAANVLSWDQSTMMPPEGAAQRARQLATLGSMVQETYVAPETGKLIDGLREWAESQPTHPQCDDAALVREAGRQREIMMAVPTDVYNEMLELYSEMYTLWAAAKPKNDFLSLVPYLKKSVRLSRKYATYFPKFEHPMDAFIQTSDYGFTYREVTQLFSSLRAELVPLAKKVHQGPEINDDCLKGTFPPEQQLAFGQMVAKALGYDFNRGRIDRSPHPFMTRFAAGDIRVTTRTRVEDFTDCFFSVVHEVGHALYEMGIAQELDGTILGGGTSSGVHESQSRLWENCVARGLPFWEYFYPELQKTFPHFNSVPLKDFHRAINRSVPSLVRVDADELTYNLHVMIRFDLEAQMLEGSLEAEDLPDAWNARYKSDLGVTPQSYKEGCMQDVHWFGGPIGGAFQGYTIGNILSAQFMAAAQKEHPHLEDEFRRGQFATLKHWLNHNVHRFGKTMDSKPLIRQATGTDLTIKPYMDYLKIKYLG